MAQNNISAEDFNALPQNVQDILVELRRIADDRQENLERTQESLDQTRQTLAVTQANASRTKPPKLPFPRTYDGRRQARALQDYLYDCAQHFANDPTQFSLESTKIRFAGSFLQESARTWFQTMDETTPKPWLTYDQFKEHLLQNFGELEPNEYWLKRWDSLQQRGSVSAYLAEFTAISAHLELTEQTKYHHFKKNLRANVQDQLALQPKPENFDALVKLANQIDSRIADRIRSANPRPAFNRGQTRPVAQTSSVPIKKEDRMQLDNIQPAAKRGPLTEEEKQYRRENKLCPYCAGQHTIETCTKRPSSTSEKKTDTPEAKN